MRPKKDPDIPAPASVTQTPGEDHQPPIKNGWDEQCAVIVEEITDDDDDELE